MYKILIVDDERSEREGIARLIRKYGYNLTVLYAENGEDALEVLEKQSVDILLTDIKMPFMGGMELIEQVHKRGWSPICIIYSAYGKFEYAQNAIRLGVVQYLLKPIQLDEFQKLLTQVIDLCEQKQKQQQESETLQRTLQGKQAEKTARTLLQFLEFGVPLPQQELPDSYLPILLSSYSVMLAQYWENYEADLHRILGEGSMVISRGDAQFFLLIQNQNLNKKQLSELCKQLIAVSRERYQTEVFIAAGSLCRTPEELKRTYDRISEQMDYQFFTSSSVYFLYNENGSLRKQSEVLPLYFEKILTFAKLEDYAGMKKEFARAFEYVEKTEGFSSIYVKYNFSNVIKKCCEILHCEERLLYAIEKIYDCSQFSQVREAVYGLIDMLSETGSKGEENNRIILLSKRMVYERYGDYTLNVSSIAQELKVSAAYLSTVFKTGTNQTLVRYITQYRMEKAKELLKTTNLRIADIAQRVGYPNPSYFISLFKNSQGDSPAKYREKIYQDE